MATANANKTKSAAAGVGDFDSRLVLFMEACVFIFVVSQVQPLSKHRRHRVVNGFSRLSKRRAKLPAEADSATSGNLWRPLIAPLDARAVREVRVIFRNFDLIEKHRAEPFDGAHGCGVIRIRSDDHPA